jgi:type IV pilus assembly protein PilM
MFSQKIFGLDISDRSIEALLLRKPFFGQTQIVAYARTNLPGGVVENGQVKNPEKLALAISELLQSAQPKPIKTPYCVLSIPESQVFTTIFKLPAGLKHKEIVNTIPYQAEEVIPFKAGEIYFDFKTIGKFDTTQEIFYVAVPIKTVDDYVDVLRRLNLKPLAFDLESISLARAVLPAPPADKAKLLIDIGGRTTNLNIFDRNGIRQNLNINLAGNHFTKAIAKALKITPKEAEKIKLKTTFEPKTEIEQQAVKALETELKKIINAVKKLIGFFQAESKREVDELILSGGSALFPKIDQFFADNLKLKTDLGEPLKGINDPKHIFKFNESAVIFSNVIGLARRGLMKNPVNGDINLLPVKPKKIVLKPEKHEKREWKSIYTQLLIFGLLSVALVGLLIARQSASIREKLFPAPKYLINEDSQVNTQLLEDLRNKLLAETATTTLAETAATTTPTSTPSLATSTPAVATSTSDKVPSVATTTPAAADVRIKIKPTSLGYLNVRQGPGTSYAKVGQAEIGKIYPVITQKGDWYQIQLDAKTQGWVFSAYVDKL